MSACFFDDGMAAGLRYIHVEAWERLGSVDQMAIQLLGYDFISFSVMTQCYLSKETRNTCLSLCVS